MSAALDTLTAHILANTLTTAEQNILAQALIAISPTFPSPDDFGNALPPPDESDAREWICALYAIQAGGPAPPVPTMPVTTVTGTAPITSTGGTTPAIGLITPARGYAVSGALVLSAAAQIAASVTITPKVSGKLKVRISGVFTNTDTSATQRPLSISVRTGATVYQTQATIESTAAGGSPSTMSASFVVDLDAATTTPTTFPLGTPVEIDAVAIGEVNGLIHLAAGGLQLEVEEAYA